MCYVNYREKLSIIIKSSFQDKYDQQSHMTITHSICNTILSIDRRGSFSTSIAVKEHENEVSNSILKQEHLAMMVLFVRYIVFSKKTRLGVPFATYIILLLLLNILANNAGLQFTNARHREVRGAVVR